MNLVRLKDRSSELLSSPLGQGYQRNFKSVLETLMGGVSMFYDGSDLVSRWRNNQIVGGWSGAVNRQFFAQLATRVGAAYRDWLLQVGSGSDQMEVPWLKLPGMSSTTGLPSVLTSLNGYLQAWWDIQVMSPVPNKYFGLFRADGEVWNRGVGDNVHHTAHMVDILPILVHFSHLLYSWDLRTARTRVQAMLTGLLMRYYYPHPEQDFTFWPDASRPMQWEVGRIGHVLNTLAAITLSQSFMVRSKAILESRNDWTDADQVTVTIESEGRFTDTKLSDLSLTAAQAMSQALDQWGLVEFQTSYTDEPTFQLRILPIILAYAPSQEVYDCVESIWSTVWRDLSAHYFAAVGDSSAPSHRNNGNWAYGLQLQWEQYSDLQYAQPLFPPMCLLDQRGCAQSAPVVPGVSGNIDGSISVQSLIWQSAQATGLAFQPFFHLRNITAQRPLRVVKQHYGYSADQQRFNFITPHYTIGSATYDTASGSSQITNVARIAGMPLGQPTQDPRGGYKVVRQQQHSIAPISHEPYRDMQLMQWLLSWHVH
jgi:hypothetical protein